MLAVLLALLMVLSACSTAQPTGPDAARALIDESAAAMGGWAALDAVKSQQIITAGGDLEPMQAVKPGGDARVINRFSQGIIADFERNRMRVSFDAIREYPNTLPVKFFEVIEGNSGMHVNPDDKATRAHMQSLPSRAACGVARLTHA